MQLASMALKALDHVERGIKKAPPSFHRDARLAKIAADRAEWEVLARDPEAE